MTDEPKKTIQQVVLEDGRYPLDAFVFLHEALARAVDDEFGEEPRDPELGSHHVTGPQLCLALRDEALERWGMLAAAVLRKWNVRATLDFGNMVYLLVNNGLMHKTEEDSLEDFRDIFDFDGAFGPAEVFGPTDDQ